MSQGDSGTFGSRQTMNAIGAAQAKQRLTGTANAASRGKGLKMGKPFNANPNPQESAYGGARLQGGGVGSGLKVQNNTSNPQANVARTTINSSNARLNQGANNNVKLKVKSSVTLPRLKVSIGKKKPMMSDGGTMYA